MGRTGPAGTFQGARYGGTVSDACPEGIFSGKAAENVPQDRRVAFGARGNEECRRSGYVARIAGPGVLGGGRDGPGRENDGKRMHGLCNFGRRGNSGRPDMGSDDVCGSAWAR